jgi:hypothetical protein
MDVLQLLKKDHAEVMKLFQRFHGNGGRGRQAMVEKICDELDVHTQVEEALFYPAVREAGDAELQRMVDEALQEHARAKEEIGHIRALSGGEGDDGSQLDGMVATLEQDIEHHVAEEEGEMFPRVQEAMDDRQRADIGRRVRDMKMQLMGGTSSRRPRRAITDRAEAGTRRRRATSGRARAHARKRRSTSSQSSRARAARGTSRTQRRARSKSATSGARSRSTGSKMKSGRRARGKKRARG